MNASPPPIGSLRDRVELHSKQVVTEPEGGQLVTYVALGTVWARVHQKSAPFAVVGDAGTVRTTHVVVMRFRADLEPGDRITYRGSTLSIIGIEDLNGRKAYVRCACTDAGTVV